MVWDSPRVSIPCTMSTLRRLQVVGLPIMREGEHGMNFGKLEIGTILILIAAGGWIARAETAHGDAEESATEIQEEINETQVEINDLRKATRILQDAALVQAAKEGNIRPRLPEGFRYCVDGDGNDSICKDE